MDIEAKLNEIGLVLPAPVKVPDGVKLPFSFVRVYEDQAYISGHGPQNVDGSIASPFGKVGTDLTIEQGYESAKLVALSMLGSLKRELGDLNRIKAWLRVFGMVNCAPDFGHQPSVINGFSDLILELYGAERGNHSRSAVGMSSLPFNIPVEIEATVMLY
jgi:enamine deaminase RidA (YjgF/YER057c/UK114 family)